MLGPLDLAAIPSFAWAAAIFYLVFVVGAWILSRLGRAIVQQCTQAFGPRLTFLLVDSPSILLHELSHLVVAIAFGHRIQEFNISGVWNPGKGGHVTTLFNPRKLRHRMGLALMGLAPVALPILLMGGVLHASHGLPTAQEVGPWFRELTYLEISTLPLSFLIGALYLHILFAASMRLSMADWITFARGGIAWATVLLVLAFLFFRGSDPWVWRPTVMLVACLAVAVSAKVVALCAVAVVAAVRGLVRSA